MKCSVALLTLSPSLILTQRVFVQLNMLLDQLQANEEHDEHVSISPECKTVDGHEPKTLRKAISKAMAIKNFFSILRDRELKLIEENFNNFCNSISQWMILNDPYQYSPAKSNITSKILDASTLKTGDVLRLTRILCLRFE